MKKLYALVAALVAAPMFAFATPVFADSPGSLATGPDLYQVRNVTTNGSYASSASAACNETVKYSIKLANSEFGLLTNVIVKASLTGGNMTASATNAANQNTNVSANVAVTVPQNATLEYVAGSTVNLNVNGGLIANLPDGITSANGVNKGNLNGSTREFVQFQAKVKCETTPPPTPTYSCTSLTVTKGNNRTVTVSGFQTASANGATFKHAVISWGDNSANTTTANPVNVTHQYAADGNYNIQATAVFTVNGQEVTATSANCVKSVSFTTEVKDIKVCELATKKVITIKETEFDASKHSKDLNDCKTVVPGKMKVCELSTKNVIEINKDQFDASKHSEDLNKCVETPVTTPEVLPNTGAGSILGLFAAVSVAAAVAHRLVWVRFSNR